MSSFLNNKQSCSVEDIGCWEDVYVAGHHVKLGDSVNDTVVRKRHVCKCELSCGVLRLTLDAGRWMVNNEF